MLEASTESWNMALGGFVLGSLILYLKGMRRMMFQLSGFHLKDPDPREDLESRSPNWGLEFRV